MIRALMVVRPDTFEWRDLPFPAPRGDEVVLRALYAGICGTDLHIVEGSHPRARFPLAIGHEVVGIPDRGPLAGQAVLVDPLLPCGACPACRAGAENACAQLRLIGIDRDGALAGSFNVLADRLHPLPSGLPLDLATMAEPIAVAQHVVRRVPELAGRDVVVLGAGPIGVLLARIATRRGANVFISEPAPARRNTAADLGFELLSAEDPAADLADRTSGRMSGAVFDAAASPKGALLVTRLVQPGGSVAVVGAYGGPTPIDLQAVMFKELSLLGHRTYLSADIDAAIDLLASDKEFIRRLLTATLPVSQAGEAVERLRAGLGMKYVLEIAS